MRQSSPKVVSAEEFGKDLRHGQLIDVREKDLNLKLLIF